MRSVWWYDVMMDGGYIWLWCCDTTSIVGDVVRGMPDYSWVGKIIAWVPRIK